MNVGGATFICPICNARAAVLDVLDFNKSCEENNGFFLPTSGIGIEYALCDACGFCFAPEMYQWSPQRFKSDVYNDAYEDVDPDYMGARAIDSAAFITQFLGHSRCAIRHLDYGGGDGFLSQLLTDEGWTTSHSWDPFVCDPSALPASGTCDLITAFEVFEHVPDLQGLMHELSSLLATPGLILLTTVLSDGHIGRGKPLDWWYAAPRNGHISLFSERSLALLAAQYDLQLGSLTPGIHMMWKNVPDWARGFIKAD